MTGFARGAAGTALGATAALALAALSQVPWVPERSPDAILRMSWRSRGERIEHCRALTAEEQENLPEHMRQRETCEGRNAVYRLAVEIDGARAVSEIAQGSGARQRRPIFVFREERLPPGPHRIRVRFTREDEGPRRAADGSPDEEEPLTRLPPELELETTVVLAPRQVILVTYDPDQRRLVERRAEPSEAEP